jgi:hypothetical protein
MHKKFWSKKFREENLLRRKSKWETNIKLNPTEIVCEVMDWIQLA